MQLDSSNLKNEEKKLKRYQEEQKENIIKIVFISMNHYEDFKRKLRKGL